MHTSLSTGDPKKDGRAMLLMLSIIARRPLFRCLMDQAGAFVICALLSPYQRVFQQLYYYCTTYSRRFFLVYYGFELY